jgi:integrase/recombinase XerD
MSQARILTDREFRKVLLYIAAHKHASRNKCLLYMSHLAGLRAKEIADLSIKDVLAEDGSYQRSNLFASSPNKGE